MNRDLPDFVDSGAIHGWRLHIRCRTNVHGFRTSAAASIASPMEKMSRQPATATSTVVAAMPTLSTPTRSSGTSSASPIIVSAAALVQSRHQAVTGSYMSPTQIREVLSDPATGTAQGVVVAGAIGIMPNLAAIVPTLGLVPDVYLRDAVGDTGVIPWTGGISSSPDVIVRQICCRQLRKLISAKAAGQKTQASLAMDVEAGQDNFVYVRVRNRGGAAAANVKATVYWSEVSTLVTPSMWNLIGSVTIPNVPDGDVLTVSDGIIWPEADIPANGHYCFVAHWTMQPIRSRRLLPSN